MFDGERAKITREINKWTPFVNGCSSKLRQTAPAVQPILCRHRAVLSLRCGGGVVSYRNCPERGAAWLCSLWPSVTAAKRPFQKPLLWKSGADSTRKDGSNKERERY